MRRTVFSSPVRDCHTQSDRDGRAPGVRRGLALLLAFVGLLAGGLQSLAVSVPAESAVFEINTGGSVPGVAAASSVDFAINTRGGAAGYANSAYLTIDTRDGSSLSVPVKAVDGLGANLAGVTVTARQNGFTVATATTTANGTATLAGLLAGYYELRAEKAGYLTQPRPHQRVPENVSPALTFVLPASLVTPVLVNSVSSPVTSLVAGGEPQPDAADPIETVQPATGTFVSQVTPDPRKMTILMTHGCESSANDWPLAMARKLAQVPDLTAKANIMAWDWEEAARAPGGRFGIVLAGATCIFPAQNTLDQGLALGQALWNALGGGTYAKPVRFHGHSLGTLVNSSAANYLHGDPPNGHSGNQLPPGATPWDWRRTHMTLFDEAELAHIFRLLPGGQQPSSPVPKHCAYLENYMTFVGFFSPKGVNVYLQRAKFLSLTLGHEYPYEWYQQTIDLFIADPARKPPNGELGFHHTFELAELTSTPAAFTIPGFFQDGSLFAQDEQSSREVDLVYLDVPEGLAARVAIEFFTSLPYGATVLNYSLKTTRFGLQTGTYVVNAVKASGAAVGRKTGQVLVTVGETFLDNYGGTLNPMADPVFGVGATTPAVIGIRGYANDLLPQPNWGLRADLFTLPAALPLGPQSQSVRTTDVTPTNTPAYVWLPVQVPSNAVALVFDFTVSGDGASDRVVAGINDSNLFSLATQFIATNTLMNSGSLFVDRWAGQDVELFFGIAGGTSTNAGVSVQNIRFLSLPLPVLVTENAGPNTLISWTESAPGFILEFSTNLTAVGSWCARTNVGGYVGQRVFTNQTSGFYRLRRQ